MLSRFLLTLSWLFAAAAPTASHAAGDYRIDYRLEPRPTQGLLLVEVRVGAGGSLKRLEFGVDRERLRDLRGDGSLEIVDGRATWTPPEKGGSLHYATKVDRRRDDGAYDARLTTEWALFRGDRVIPRLHSVVAKGSRADATLTFLLPPGWTAETGYARNRDGAFHVVNAGRRFQSPRGWIALGQLGVRRDRFGTTDVVIAAPKGQDMRRQDVLAFLGWSWKSVQEVFPQMPRKLMIVGAGDPFWRGGLSAPNSFYLHTDRPLISEDGTSPLLHELFHTLSHIQGRRGDDWIAEGLAEYYSIELQRRAGALSDERHEKTLRRLREIGGRVKTLHHRASSGAITARAVLLFREVDAEIHRRTNDERSLDDVVRALLPLGRVSLDDLRTTTTRVVGEPLSALDSPLLR